MHSLTARHCSRHLYVRLQLSIIKSQWSKDYYSHFIGKEKKRWRSGAELWHFFLLKKLFSQSLQVTYIYTGVQAKHNVAHSVLCQDRRHGRLSNSLQSLQQWQHGSLIEKNQAHCRNLFCNTQVKPFSSNVMLCCQEFRKLERIELACKVSFSPVF